MWKIVLAIIFVLFLICYKSDTIRQESFSMMEEHSKNEEIEYEDSENNAKKLVKIDAEEEEEEEAEKSLEEAEIVLSNLMDNNKSNNNNNNNKNKYKLKTAIDIYLSKNKNCIDKHANKIKPAFDWYLREKLKIYIEKTCQSSNHLGRKEKRKIYQEYLIKVINKAPPCEIIIDQYLEGSIRNDIYELSDTEVVNIPINTNSINNSIEIEEEANFPTITPMANYLNITNGMETEEVQDNGMEQDEIGYNGMETDETPEMEREEINILGDETYPNIYREESTNGIKSYDEIIKPNPPFAVTPPTYTDNSLSRKQLCNNTSAKCCSSISVNKKQEPGWMYIPSEFNSLKNKNKYKSKSKNKTPPVPSLTSGYPTNNLQFQNIINAECEKDKNPNCNC